MLPTIFNTVFPTALFNTEGIFGYNCSGFSYKSPIVRPPVLEEKNLFHSIPQEIWAKIFFDNNLRHLAMASKISRAWYDLLKNLEFWKRAIYREEAFSDKDWIHSLGEGVLDENERIQAFPSLPDNIVEILKKRNGMYFLVWIPTTLQGKTIEEFIGKKKFFKRSYFSFEGDYFSNQLKYSVDGKSYLLPKFSRLEKARWVLMTTEQGAEYAPPASWESVVSIFAEYLRMRKYEAFFGKRCIGSPSKTRWKSFEERGFQSCKI